MPPSNALLLHRRYGHMCELGERQPRRRRGQRFLVFRQQFGRRIRQQLIEQERRTVIRAGRRREQRMKYALPVFFAISCARFPR